ncbi:MAG: glycine--tRNA ligase, partial [Candidatus Nanohaloarchaeota archaeon]|nr:glycine--tRNA ligase [Candidatus Nanohaloarchaeota archaeon]
MDIQSFAKKTGFIMISGELYGGLKGFWDYLPRGVALKNAIKQRWWDFFVRSREDMHGMDGSIITHPKVWVASGHVENFTDPIVVCKRCGTQFRADHLLEDLKGIKTENLSLEEMENLLQDVKCPACKKGELEAPKRFNLMFRTFVGPKEGKENEAFLRPETAQNIFVNFKHIAEVMRAKLPFGIAQIGKAFRNEISPRNFIFRSREFEQAEIEYFIHPAEKNRCPYLDEIAWDKKVAVYTADMQLAMKEPELMSWKELNKIIKDNWHLYWLYKSYEFFKMLGLKDKNLRLRQHVPEELSHYSEDTWDIEFNYSFGWKELMGIANRGSYDLHQHAKTSSKDLRIMQDGEKVMPYVIEPSFGIDRLVLALLEQGYEEREGKAVLKLHPSLAPIKVAVFPLVSRDGLDTKAKEVYGRLKPHLKDVFYDEKGSIGKRYARMDEIGTPYCITIDYNTLKDETVTLRNRDTTEQIILPINVLQ